VGFGAFGMACECIDCGNGGSYTFCDGINGREICDRGHSVGMWSADFVSTCIDWLDTWGRQHLPPNPFLGFIECDQLAPRVEAVNGTFIWNNTPFDAPPNDYESPQGVAPDRNDGTRRGVCPPAYEVRRRWTFTTQLNLPVGSGDFSYLGFEWSPQPIAQSLFIRLTNFHNSGVARLTIPSWNGAIAVRDTPLHFNRPVTTELEIWPTVPIIEYPNELWNWDWFYDDALISSGRNGRLRRPNHTEPLSYCSPPGGFVKGTSNGSGSGIGFILSELTITANVPV